MSDAPESPDGPQPSKTGRGLKIALGLSLAVNLLIVGTLAGAVWGKLGGPRGDEGPMALRSLGLGPMVFALDREDRAALRARIEDQRRELRPAVRGVGASIGAFADALRSAPFDREAAAAALAESRVQIEMVQMNGHEILLDHLETMTPEDRADLADRLERRLRQGRPEGWRPHG